MICDNCINILLLFTIRQKIKSPKESLPNGYLTEATLSFVHRFVNDTHSQKISNKCASFVTALFVDNMW